MKTEQNRATNYKQKHLKWMKNATNCLCVCMSDCHSNNRKKLQKIKYKTREIHHQNKIEKNV